MIEINQYSSEEIHQVWESYKLIHDYLFDKFIINGNIHGPDCMLFVLCSLFKDNLCQHNGEKQKEMLEVINKQFLGKWHQMEVKNGPANSI